MSLLEPTLGSFEIGDIVVSWGRRATTGFPAVALTRSAVDRDSKGGHVVSLAVALFEEIGGMHCGPHSELVVWKGSRLYIFNINAFLNTGKMPEAVNRVLEHSCNISDAAGVALEPDQPGRSRVVAFVDERREVFCAHPDCQLVWRIFTGENRVREGATAALRQLADTPIMSDIPDQSLTGWFRFFAEKEPEYSTAWVVHEVEGTNMQFHEFRRPYCDFGGRRCAKPERVGNYLDKVRHRPVAAFFVDMFNAGLVPPPGSPLAEALAQLAARVHVSRCNNDGAAASSGADDDDDSNEKGEK